MEHGNSFFHYGQPEKSSSDSKPLQGEGNRGCEVVQQAEAAREENRSMPIACVQRLIRKVLPKHAKVTDESKETILECVTEFISFITGEANHHCKVERRKTVTAEDLIYAMGKVGFYEYAELLTIYLHRYRQHHEGANRVPHRMGSLPTLPTNAPMFPPSPSFVTGFPMMPPNPFSFPNPMSDGSSGGRFSSANVYYDPPVAYFNRDNYFRN